VNRWLPDVGPSVANRATTRVFGWVVENDFDEIELEGKFCCVTELAVVAARLPGPPSCTPSMAVATKPAIIADQRPTWWSPRGRAAGGDAGIPAPSGAAPSLKPTRAIGILSVMGSFQLDSVPELRTRTASIGRPRPDDRAALGWDCNGRS
jgi:hypothetical protein